MHGEPDGQGGPHVFVADVDHPELSDDDRHHLERVLRLRSGDSLTMSDGRGRWRRCHFGDELEAAGDAVDVPANEIELTVAVALVKGSRPELVVRELTELGLDHIALFAAERSVVQWDEAKVASQRERLEKVAREAAMQCRRVWLPELEILADLTGLIARPGSALADFDGGPVTADHRVIVVGPEGGWTDEERSLSSAHVRLGRHVLRSETAALAAGVQLVSHRETVSGR
ncbi:MAG: 16S rRNA (uracil(1498)-N(3))-methyltransferase [Acidimicrobiales bacterium]